jgi:hypothetical protein
MKRVYLILPPFMKIYEFKVMSYSWQNHRKTAKKSIFIIYGTV